uniref:Secreted protein n=1 Tax=Bursaphelenchus xylophilus TaxID=6326 RepID=A0A1I7S5C0_BURXY
MLRLFWPLFWATVVAAVYEYDGEVPTIKIKYSEDKDAKESTGLLTMATVDTLVLSKECAKKDTCTPYEHTSYYDKDINKDKKSRTISIDYLNYKLKCGLYTARLIFGNYNSDSAPIYAVESVENNKLDLPQDALVGLEFGDSLDKGFAISSFMENAGNGKKVMIFRTGPFIQQLVSLV